MKYDWDTKSEIEIPLTILDLFNVSMDDNRNLTLKNNVINIFLKTHPY